MRILVFGGRGFIGQHLIDNLMRKNHRVVSCDRKSVMVWQRIPDEIVRMDIKDREAVFDAMNHCDGWINLAGLLGTSELVERADDAVAVNIQGALNIFNAACQFVKPGVQITVGNHWMNNPYSITKSTAERFALMYNKELGADIRVVRAMNVYGPGQKASPIRKFFPNAVLAALRDEPVVLYGDGSQVMDFMFVKDAAEVLARFVLKDRLDNSSVYECGTGDPFTLKQTTEEIIALAGSQSTIRYAPMRPGEPPASEVRMSEDGARRLIRAIAYDTESMTPREAAFRETIEWYRENVLC